MYLRCCSAALVLACVALTGGPGKAQPPAGPPRGPTSPPPFSPYLNLARQGTSPAVNYYGIVRPQVQFSNSIQTLQRQANQFGPFSGADAAPDQPAVTGNGFGFQNHLAYYQNQYSSAGFGRSGVAGAPAGLGRPSAGGSGQQLGAPPPRRK